jgi:pimeloyl-ACP methyl ester carboxylesterase
VHRSLFAFAALAAASVFCAPPLAGLTATRPAARPNPPRGTPALLWGDLRPGAFSVGFRVLYERDKTRNWLGSPSKMNAAIGADPGRPIRISLWYPAIPALDAKPMRYEDYFHFAGPADFKALDDALERSDRESWTADLAEVSPHGAEIFARLLATQVAAFASAPMARGRFPIVLYAPGLGARADSNVEFAEFLASHGYVVATVPQLGPSSADLANGSSPAEIALHVRDMEAAAEVLRRQPGFDVGRIAVVGHSAGGIAAFDFAMQNPNTKAIVGLDGSYGFRGGERIFRRVVGYDPRRVRASILDLRRANGVQGADLDLAALDDAVLADRYLVTFPRMFHGDFTEFGPIGLKLSVPLPPNNDERTRQTGYDGNQYAYRALLSFLDAKLRDRRAGIDELDVEIHKSDGTIVHLVPGARRMQPGFL